MNGKFVYKTYFYIEIVLFTINISIFLGILGYLSFHMLRAAIHY